MLSPAKIAKIDSVLGLIMAPEIPGDDQIVDDC